MSAVDARLPIVDPSPMGAHRRQVRARDARNAAKKTEAAQPYVEPGPWACRARELLGTRVCDQDPHGPGVPHEGAGPKDERRAFWGARPQGRP